jgi:transcriptional regulator with GAF, ATPase, and Fis domain
MNVSTQRHPPSSDEGIVGSGLRQVEDAVDRVLGIDVDVLIVGESGTGKELVARRLHEADPLRGRSPFVPINCAALPEALLEADLFGHRQGAFTGAGEDRPGLFQQARGGTLFLDEVGELPAALQPKLLRALQERQVRRVGGTEEEPVDVRVVSATNRDLGQAMEQGHFRPDLYFRLADYVIAVPPLRQRRGDIPVLARHFLDAYRERFHRRHVLELSDAAVAWLQGRDWRANNVRELSVAMKRAVLQCDEAVLTEQHLWAACAGDDPWAAAATGPPVDERQLLRQALRQCGGNVAAAARLLGMKRSTLFDRLNRYGLRDRRSPT